MTQLVQTEDIRTEIETLLGKAFAEDHAFDDITTKACIDEEEEAVAHFFLKEDACIAGLQFIPGIFSFLDRRLKTEVFFEEGEMAPAQSKLATVSGNARSILSAERVALNLLQHLCGIATLTQACLSKVKGTGCQILDTRKTIPGLRLLQKYAVRIAGGTNHRPHLAGGILIKNNHLAVASNYSQNPIAYALEKVQLTYPFQEIEVEVSSLPQLTAALAAGADRILLDNMSVDEVKKCVTKAKGKAYLEASGGITLDTVRAYAETGVNGISIGALTHSVQAIDIALRIQL